MKSILINLSKKLLLVLGLILFPISVCLFLIWPSRVFKDRMKKAWKIFLWVLYAPVALFNITSKIIFVTFVILIANEPYTPNSYINTKAINPATYRTADDFHKLTGVEFPDLQLVDSLAFTDDGMFTSYYWDEFTFVAKDGLDASFYENLDMICASDSNHWSVGKGSFADDVYKNIGQPTNEDEIIYKYWIYPDSKFVDRSKGSCDRMVEIEPGKYTTDWDGGFVSVEIHKNTVVLREGWLR